MLMGRHALCRYAMAAAVCWAAVPAFAQEDAWMVKENGAVACRERTVQAGVLDSGGNAMPSGCIPLIAGERLVDMAEAGAGYSEMLRVQRHDGSILFVEAQAIAHDPGIGSLSGDCAGEAR
jgi:hypothetical protein